MATRRRCSVCHRVGHDKRAHGRIRRPAVRASGRRNPTPPAHRITVKKLRHVVDSHGPYAMAEVTIGGRSATVRARGPRGGRAYSADEMIAAAARQLGVDLRRNPKNPDFFRDTFGRAHPVRGTPDYEDGFVGMSRADKRYLKSGSDQARGGYTQELPGRDARAAAARLRRRQARGRGKTDTGAYERLASGRTRAQKEADANRRRRVFG